MSNLLSHVYTVDDVATLQENLTRISYNNYISLVNVNTSCNSTGEVNFSTRPPTIPNVLVIVHIEGPYVACIIDINVK